MYVIARIRILATKQSLIRMRRLLRSARNDMNGFKDTCKQKASQRPGERDLISKEILQPAQACSTDFMPYFILAIGDVRASLLENVD